MSKTEAPVRDDAGCENLAQILAVAHKSGGGFWEPMSDRRLAKGRGAWATDLRPVLRPAREAERGGSMPT